MAKKQPLKPPTRPVGRASTVGDRLREAQGLLRAKRWSAARDVLVPLTHSDPKDPRAWSLLVDAYIGMNDMQGYQLAVERMLALDPKQHELRLGLAVAYARNGLPALALRTLREFVRLAPDHAQAAQARAMAGELEAGMPVLLTELGVEGGAGQKLAELHEEVQSALAQGDYLRARQTAQTALRQKPDLIPVLNNLTQANAADGDLPEALAVAERALAIQPDNIHALSNRARILALMGRFEDGRQAARLMLNSSARAVGAVTKKTEALSFLGMDQEVLDVFEVYLASDPQDTERSSGLAWHLAATAAARLGREADARTWWQEALKRQPGLALALENLADLDRPVGQRNGPWAFSLSYWLGRTVVRELQRDFKSAGKDGSTSGPARRILRRRPELLALIPVWLERGAPDARELALMLTEAADTPEAADLGRDFALGQAGTDAQRMRAAQTAVDRGAIPSGSIRFWSRGAWRDVLLMGFELHTEPVRVQRHKPQVEQWLKQSLALNDSGDFEDAEALLKQALAQEPDAPDLLNNLAASYAARDMLPEAESIWRGLLERLPDYVFARASLARLAAKRGDTSEARQLLDPLLARRRLHLSEFDSLVIAEVDTALASGQPHAASSWLDLWKQASPDDPRIDIFRQEIERYEGKP